MNPLIVNFILAMFIEDYLFREGKFLKYYLYSLLFYSLFYYFHHRSTYHTYSKKYNMAAFDQSFDPTVYAQVLFDITKAKQFIKQMSEKTGKKITLTVFWIKVVGEVFKRIPECNEMIRFGIKVKREEVDIGVLVNVGDKDLANMTIRNVPGKTMAEISDELYREADIYRKEKNKTHNNGLRALRKLPSLYNIIFILLFLFISLIEILLELDSILANMGINCKPLGVKNIFLIFLFFRLQKINMVQL